MIADQMRQNFAYNEWAWARVLASLERLDDDAYKAERPVFWRSLHQLLVHCLTAEEIWLTRLGGDSPDALLNPDDFADLTAVLDHWVGVRRRWRGYLDRLTDDNCRQSFTYANTSGDRFTLRVADVLQHVVNHASDHRGQMTPTLAALGVPTEPLDYVFFIRRPVT